MALNDWPSSPNSSLDFNSGMPVSSPEETLRALSISCCTGFTNRWAKAMASRVISRISRVTEIKI